MDRITLIFRAKFASCLLAWWKNNKKWYPFRETSDPYKVLISEILLRKTKAEQVAPVYKAFFTKFPDPYSVSCSSPEEIIKTIKSLGLVSRAYDIFEICNILCNEKGGKVPSTARELNALPGVGRYITNVVLTMGFGKPKPMVDSNVKRILSRLTGFAAPYKNSDRLWNIYNEILKIIKYREMHFAMIDLAHQVCVPNQPLCSECPVRELCRYNKEKIQFSVK